MNVYGEKIDMDKKREAELKRSGYAIKKRKCPACGKVMGAYRRWTTDISTTYICDNEECNFLGIKRILES